MRLVRRRVCYCRIHKISFWSHTGAILEKAWWLVASLSCTPSSTGSCWESLNWRRELIWPDSLSNLIYLQNFSKMISSMTPFTRSMTPLTKCCATRGLCFSILTCCLFAPSMKNWWKVLRLITKSVNSWGPQVSPRQKLKRSEEC